MQAIPDSEFFITPLKIRDHREYQALQKLREDAFTPWLPAYPPRLMFNLAAGVFDGFLLEARLASGKVVGYVFSAPAFWSGDPADLQTYDYHKRSLYQRLLPKAASIVCVGPLRSLKPRLRKAYLGGSNCIVLLAMLIQQEYRGCGIPVRFIDHLKKVAATNGYNCLISPFRPNGYGRYKEQSRQAHSAELFSKYCYEKNGEGLPVDPWLRTLVQNGMKMLKPEPCSMQVTRSLRTFDNFRKTFDPERWYQTSEQAWECGETPTWYTDLSAKTATSVEPNMWGMFSL